MTEKKKTIVVTGGAGYIGRCTAEILLHLGCTPVILDDFSTGRREAVGDLNCIQVDLADREKTLEAFKTIGKCHGVIHFAAKALVSESCEHPEMYFRNNLMATLNVAEATINSNASYLVHSSSCAVYGVPQQVPITEQTALNPLSPYGESKLMAERVLSNLCQYRGLRAINLRYFNPSGSVAQGKCGEAHDPETHLIPNVLSAGIEKRPVFIFGDDYDTPDGTCIRDYIHIEDLVQAHIAALEYLEKPGNKERFINLGSGKGTSVKEVIETAQQVLGTKIQVERRDRRPGDPPKLIADISLAKRVLNWTPTKNVGQAIKDHALFLSKRK